ncbi:MAG TPA: hypothetical protein VMV08_02740 [Gaiellaceae bacterium]|nr:hypothetical protein [Gaiellaceae bacterium]
MERAEAEAIYDVEVRDRASADCHEKVVGLTREVREGHGRCRDARAACEDAYSCASLGIFTAAPLSRSRPAKCDSTHGNAPVLLVVRTDTERV